MMTNIARDWVWMLAFFPLWFVSAGTCFALVSGPKRAAGTGTRKFLDGSALVLSICVAAAVLIELDCTGHISLPFAEPACRMSDYVGGLPSIDQAKWAKLQSLASVFE